MEGKWAFQTTSESPKRLPLTLAQALTLGSKTQAGGLLLGSARRPRRARVGQGPGGPAALLLVLLQPLCTGDAAADG